MFVEFFQHRHSSPWRSEVDLKDFIWFFQTLRMDFDNVAASELFDHRREHVLGEFHQIVEISVSHIKLATGVLWVVSLID